MPTITRETKTLDATGQSLGRLSTQIATILRGKDKPSWEPHIDAGDFVEVTNLDKVKITGKKLTDKIYYHHTGYPGGIRSQTLKEKIEKKGYDQVLADMVYNMLPDNKTRKTLMKRLIVKASE